MATSTSPDEIKVVSPNEVTSLEIRAARMPPLKSQTPKVALAILTLIVVIVGSISVAAVAVVSDLNTQLIQVKSALVNLSKVVDAEEHEEHDHHTHDGPDILLSRSGTPSPGYQAVGLFDGEWAPNVMMPSERSDFHAVYCGGSIVLLGGLDKSNNVLDTVWLFDPAQETYTTGRATMPTPRFRFGAACLAGKVYVAGGYTTKANGDNGDCVDTVDVYDVAANTWSSGPRMSLKRGDLALIAVGTGSEGRIHAIGGYGFQYPPVDPAMTSNEALDPLTGAWTARAPLPGGKGDISAVVIADPVTGKEKIYVPGGWNAKFKSTLDAFDPSTNSWESKAAMSIPRGDKAIAALDGHLYVMGGELWTGKTEACPWDASLQCDVNKLPTHSCESYSPRQNAWVNFAPIPTPLFRFAAAAANGIVYTFGGQAHGENAVYESHKFLHVNKPDVFIHVKSS